MQATVVLFSSGMIIIAILINQLNPSVKEKYKFLANKLMNSMIGGMIVLGRFIGQYGQL